MLAIGLVQIQIVMRCGMLNKGVEGMGAEAKQKRHELISSGLYLPRG